MPNSVPSSGGLLSAVSAKFIMAVTLLLCGAALWNGTSFGPGEVAWFVAFVVVLLIRAPHSKRNAANRIAKSGAGLRDMVVFPLLLTAMVLPLSYLAGWLPTSLDYSLPGWMTYLGIALQFPYLWLFYRSHADLTRNWSSGLEIRCDHELVTGGVYKHIRHPMYVAVAISAAAQPLVLENWIAGPPALFMTILFLALRVPEEERMMLAHFGDDYRRYCERTGNFLPPLRKNRLG